MSDTTEKYSEKYIKLDEISHTLHAPDVLLGPIKPITTQRFVQTDSGVVEYKSIEYSPGLLKLFTEVLSNAIDHHFEHPECNRIEIVVDPSTDVFSVSNNGPHVPIEKSKEHKVYFPELIFGHLRTSEKYTATESTKGGKNGVGVKVVNIFSTQFIVETWGDGKMYKQIWENNMRKCNTPVITKIGKSSSGTTVVWYPELHRFGVTVITQDFVDLLRMCSNIACIEGLTVTFNNVIRKPLTMLSFSRLITEGKRTSTSTVDSDIVVVESVGSYQHYGVVNGLPVNEGIHIDNWVKAISAAVASTLRSKVGRAGGYEKVRAPDVASRIWVFIKCKLNKPEFTGQSKSYLSHPAPTVNVTDALIAAITKFDSIKELKAESAKKSFTALDVFGKETRGKKKMPPKAKDSPKAGTKESNKCTLILVEGDSAMTFVLSGINTLKDSSYYGVFPVKGKVINVRGITEKNIGKNVELESIKTLLGLRVNCEYKTQAEFNTLRYHKLCIVTDADEDGTHIKGLIVNFILYYWPELGKTDLLSTILTPIVRVTQGKVVHKFYDLRQHSEWVARNPNVRCTTKYYKGLGSNTSKEAGDIFKNKMEEIFTCETDDDFEALSLAFAKERANDRKKWLLDFSAERGNTFQKVYTNTRNIHDFIHEDLIHFSIADNVRSLPCIFDGLKQSQRKILFTLMKKNRPFTKVEQLAGAVSEISCYHHGAISLQETIVGMAQKFTGKGNITLLDQDGQLGTRRKGGDDSAAARYIYAKLSDTAKTLFNALDSPILKYITDDGVECEPETYYPIIPMLLVNGSTGIGTGFSTSIPCYNPKDLISFIRIYLTAAIEDLETFDSPDLIPWYSGFKGTITKQSEIKVVTSGVYTVSENKIIITELPIGLWTADFLEKVKEFEETLVVDDKADANHENIVITIETDNIDALEAKLKPLMSTAISLNNMVAISPKGIPKRYGSPDEIMMEYIEARVEIYKERKTYLLCELQDKIKLLDNKRKFIYGVVNGEIHILKQTEEYILEQLQQFDKIDDSYEYLLSLRIDKFSKESYEKLANQIEDLRHEYNELESKSEYVLWRDDLDVLEKVL